MSAAGPSRKPWQFAENSLLGQSARETVASLKRNL
jgi:hypothetical protein